VKVCFTPSAWRDYVWIQEHDHRLLARLNMLIRDTLRCPSEGIGKPEPLRGELSGYWSRRINDQHRLVYAVTGEALVIIACRYHYGV